MKPLCIDLYCGLGGWSEGFLSEGYECIGFDTERHDYGAGGYRASLCLQDVLTLHGSQFRNAACIVASPPCQRYSYMAMPWGRAKVEVAWQRYFRDSGSPFADPFTLNALFDACFRIQREASEAAGHHIPMVVENVKGAQQWVGSARWHFGSYYLWGDVPALMPSTETLRKGMGGTWFNVAHGKRREGDNAGNPVRGEFLTHTAARTAASAQIAKIPFELSNWIARWAKPPSFFPCKPLRNGVESVL
jgi:hypothetical protein